MPNDTCDVSFIRDFVFTAEFLAGKFFVMFGEDKTPPVYFV
jgi:hypothetical protein